MKKIASSVYGNLTPQQRVIACVAALARGDEKERQRLIRSCQRKTYSQLDAQFSATMERLMGLAMAVEADLKECILKWFIAVRADPVNSGDFLHNFANVRQAWRLTLAAMGIDAESMALAGPPSSSVFELVEPLLPKPEANRSEELCAEMLECLEQIGGI